VRERETTTTAIRSDEGIMNKRASECKGEGAPVKKWLVASAEEVKKKVPECLSV
jgi:hypothetical protein